MTYARMASMRRSFAVLGLFALVAGCGKEAGRVPLPGAGSGATALTLAPGDVALWTDIDISYEGDAALHYDVEFVQGGVTVANAKCNPLGPLSVKTSWVETNLGFEHSRSGNGKMDCSTKLATGGGTEVRTNLIVDRKGTKLTIKKADLVIKQ